MDKDKEVNKKQIREHILDAIKSSRIIMRPKWHFVLKAALMAIGGIILFLTLLYLASFILFVLRRTGIWFVPVFGARGWYAFLISFPWLLIGASAIFFIILEVLVRRYAFAYKRPLLFSLLGIVILVFVGVIIVDLTHVQGRFSRFTEEHRVPFARDFYHRFGPPRFGNIHKGDITEITPVGFLMSESEEGGESFSVIITPQTRLPFGAGFSIGDAVVVFGDRESSTIQAFGVRKVANEY